MEVSPYHTGGAGSLRASRVPIRARQTNNMMVLILFYPTGTNPILESRLRTKIRHSMTAQRRRGKMHSLFGKGSNGHAPFEHWWRRRESNPAGLAGLPALILVLAFCVLHSAF